ncbi:hypothetical protein OROGR_031417 [Orobanche gracilis]
MVPMMINATAKIDSIIQLHGLSRNLLRHPEKSRSYPFILSIRNPSRKTLRISCHEEKEKTLTDGEMLAVELSLEIKKFNSNTIHREEVLEKSREILFAEVCSFMGLKSEDFRKKWRRMKEGEKSVMAEVFVAGWSDHFHPLSARSVKEMVGEYLGKCDGPSDDSGSSRLFSNLIKLLGGFRK